MRPRYLTIASVLVAMITGQAYTMCVTADQQIIVGVPIACEKPVNRAAEVTAAWSRDEPTENWKPAFDWEPYVQEKLENTKGVIVRIKLQRTRPIHFVRNEQEEWVNRPGEWKPESTEREYLYLSNKPDPCNKFKNVKSVTFLTGWRCCDEIPPPGVDCLLHMDRVLEVPHKMKSWAE